MPRDNPYDAPLCSDQPEVRRTLDGFLGVAAFALVLAVAVVSGLIPLAIAWLVDAPRQLVWIVLGVSLATTVPLGLLLGYFTSCYVTRRGPLSRIWSFFAVFLVVIPLALYPQTTGPLVGYIAFALAITIGAALIVGIALRRWNDGERVDPQR
jgi:hypothetical protein